MYAFKETCKIMDLFEYSFKLQDLGLFMKFENYVRRSPFIRPRLLTFMQDQSNVNLAFRSGYRIPFTAYFYHKPVNL